MSVAAQGIHPKRGALVYTDPLTQVERIALTTPEEEAVRFLLDGLGVDTIRELHALVEDGKALNRESGLALWFTPQCIRDHYDGDEGPEADWVSTATDEELAGVGSDALGYDPLYREFHSSLQDCVRERAGIEA